MNKYFIYFSLTGNGDYLASLLKEKGYQPIKIETVKPIGKPTFFKIFRYGGLAMKKAKTPIQQIDIQLKEDDEVIIGSPIWNDRLSTPINTVLASLDLNKNTTRFILYPAGNKTKKSLIQIAKLGYVLPPLMIQYPLKYQEQAVKLLEEWL